MNRLPTRRNVSRDVVVVDTVKGMVNSNVRSGVIIITLIIIMGVIKTMEMGLEWHTVATRGCAIASARLAAGITLTLQGFTQIGRA